MNDTVILKTITEILLSISTGDVLIGLGLLLLSLIMITAMIDEF